MKRLERTAEIAAPAAELFSLVSDPVQLPRWQSGITSARQTTPGPTAVGSVAHVVRELMGQHIEVDLTVTAYEPGRRFSLESEASGFHVNATLLLDPIDDARTLITFSMEVAATSIFMAPVEGMVVGAAASDVEESLHRLEAIFRGRD